ncbi:PLCXc domain-containing protein [Mycena indigotica]|uniref:Autophagy-related protein 27 n=1 Tax=Mycena indigotica TaxID=2126181 RepID=A0A8H6RYS4_9AGAR|nr:PLCXc domain-containing protein [Mycena indigotica]KAF7290225.1 PLCXc domain-containing protein [Mycena indigotica]
MLLRTTATATAIVLLGLGVGVLGDEAKACTGRNAGKYYDLSGLRNAKDYSLKTPGGQELVINACGAVAHETWGLKKDDVDDPAKVAGFTRREHGDFSLGQVNTTLTFGARSGYPHLVFTDGSRCLDSDGKKVDNLRGSAEIEFVCDPAAGKGSPRLVAALPPGNRACAFVFEWRSANACATSEGWTFGSFLWFLLSTCFSLLLAYLIVGFIYNTLALGLRGMEAVPRFSLAGAVHHAREAGEMAVDWWATSGPGRGRFGLRGDGMRAGGAGRRFGRDAEVGGDVEEEEGLLGGKPRAERAQSMAAPPVVSAATANGAHGPIPMPVPVPLPMPTPAGLNPASHQAQVMAGQGQGQAMEDMPAPTPLQNAAIGLNPASHQAQVLASMPVAHLSRSPAPGVGPMAPLTPGRERFALGDGEEEDDEEDEVGAVKL